MPYGKQHCYSGGGITLAELAYHGGWNEGFLTEWYFSLDDDLCVASMINRVNNSTDEAHTQAAFDIYVNVNGDKPADL